MLDILEMVLFLRLYNARANREITNVRLAEPNNRFVTVSYIQPSNPTHYGYNFTDKGIIVLASSCPLEFVCILDVIPITLNSPPCNTSV